MTHPVLHFEVSGKNLDSLQAFYGELFGWAAEDAGEDYGHYHNLSKDGALVEIRSGLTLGDTVVLGVASIGLLYGVFRGFTALGDLTASAVVRSHHEGVTGARHRGRPLRRSRRRH